MTFIDYIETPIQEMAERLSEVQQSLDSLQELNKHFVQFNVSFGTMLMGMKAATRITEFPEASHECLVFFDLMLNRQAPPSFLPTAQSPRSDFNTIHDGLPVDETRSASQITKQAAKGNPRHPKRPQRKSQSQVIKSILDDLPAKYQELPHRHHTEAIVKGLLNNRDGMYLHELIREASLSRTKIMEYLNALVESRNVSKLSRKGLLFTLNRPKQGVS
ncbi:DASH complex subunit dam1 [Dimargaris verticillata]|uniref:DASH complex subunit dam1 n=1 Tax=Dimargaris verticillata TaxID=2761393 RepID=A0A9W8B6L2_9FUNG|nr:DASH complex subunit dam1 [Dimargaris verticillata]